MKEKKNHRFQSDNNLNDTGRLCKKKLFVVVISSLHAPKYLGAFGKMLSGDNVLAQSQ